MDYELLGFGVEYEVPLVVEREGEELDFFRHFVEVALDFIFFVLQVRRQD